MKKRYSMIFKSNLAITITKGEIYMRKSIFEETGGTYSQAGGCLLPNLVTGAHEHITVGVWGWRHLKYIQEYRPILYNRLVLNDKLSSYLAEIDQQARDRLDTIIQQTAQAQAQGITEKLKADDPMAWVGRMNNIRCAAEEIISKEIIFL